MTFNFLIIKVFIEKYNKVDFSVKIDGKDLIIDFLYWRVFVS